MVGFTGKSIRCPHIVKLGVVFTFKYLPQLHQLSIHTAFLESEDFPSLTRTKLHSGIQLFIDPLNKLWELPLCA
jgi:hypothetical protein